MFAFFLPLTQQSDEMTCALKEILNLMTYSFPFVPGKDHKETNLRWFSLRIFMFILHLLNSIDRKSDYSRKTWLTSLGKIGCGSRHDDLCLCIEQEAPILLIDEYLVPEKTGWRSGVCQTNEPTNCRGKNNSVGYSSVTKRIAKTHVCSCGFRFVLSSRDGKMRRARQIFRTWMTLWLIEHPDSKGFVMRAFH